VGLADMYSEHVPPRAFVTEAQQLLDDSLTGNAALRQALTEHDWCDRGLGQGALSQQHLRDAFGVQMYGESFARSGTSDTMYGAQDRRGRSEGRRGDRAQRKDGGQRRLADGVVARDVDDQGGMTVASHDPERHLAYPRHYSAAACAKFVMDRVYCKQKCLNPALTGKSASSTAAQRAIDMDPAPGSLDELRALQRLATLNSRQAVPPRHDYRPQEAGQYDKDAQAAAKAVPDEQTQRLSQYWCALSSAHPPRPVRRRG